MTSNKLCWAGLTGPVSHFPSPALQLKMYFFISRRAYKKLNRLVSEANAIDMLFMFEFYPSSFGSLNSIAAVKSLTSLQFLYFLKGLELSAWVRPYQHQSGRPLTSTLMCLGHSYAFKAVFFQAKLFHITALIFTCFLITMINVQQVHSGRTVTYI